MNIKRAKQEIKDTIEAYFLKMSGANMKYRRSGKDRSCS